MKTFLSLSVHAKRSIVAMTSLVAVTCLFLFAACKKELKAGRPVALTYDKMFLIGDATTAGWTIANALPMTKSADNTNVFTWTGPLAAGEIKFPTALSFSSDTFSAATAAQPVANNKAQLSPSGNPDVKWKLAASDAGTYKISLNTQDLTVTFQKQ